MQTRFQKFFNSVIIALSVTFALTVVSYAQPESSPDKTAASPPVATANGSTEAELSSEHSGMRRLDETVTTEVAPDSDAVSESRAMVSDEEGQDEAMETEESSDVEIGDHTVPEGNSVSEVVSFFGDSVLEGESRGGVVSIVGNTTVRGSAGGEAVAILGNTTVGTNALVQGEAVAVMGDIYIDGKVEGEVVAVIGSVTLGPNAVVDGEVVVIGGQLHRDAGAVVHGNVQELNFLGDGHHVQSLRAWFHECLLWGRPLAFNNDVRWAWYIAIAVFGFYVFLALLFPRGIDKCIATLNERPGYSLLSVLLTALITPVLIVLLVATGLGILILPFLMAGIFFGGLFGKAVMHAWLGRKLTRHFGDGAMNHAAVATLVGSVLILLLYTVPFLGFFVWKVFGMIGWGVVVYTLVLEIRKNRPVPAPPLVAKSAAAATASGIAMPLSGGGSPTEETATSAVELPLSALPRAGFWLRLGAVGIDVIIVGVVGSLLHISDWFLMVFAVYSMVLWALKGSTIGGIVCGLQIVRLDERPVDWTVAVVRVLGGFLSLVVMGLGFIWIAFDEQKQAWHDKIAGTVVVRAPKGTSLI